MWLIVLSGHGISLGEIGKLPTDSDSNLLGNYLATFKNVLTEEASSQTSNFMSGDLETSSYGVFSFVITNELPLIVGYVLSNQEGIPVDQRAKTISASFCDYFGKQVLQIEDIETLATIGKKIRHDILTKIFLSTCYKIRLERNFPNHKKLAIKEFRKVTQDTFKNKKRSIQLIGFLFRDKNWKENEIHWIGGLITGEKRLRLVEMLTIFIMSEVINSDPKLLINLDRKTNVIPEFQKEIENFLKTTVKAPETPIINYMKQKLTKAFFVEQSRKIGLYSLHNQEEIIFTMLLKEAFLATFKEETKIIFVEINKSLLQDIFQEHFTPPIHNNAGFFYTQILGLSTSTISKGYIKSFYDSFFKKMKWSVLTQPAWEILNSFATEIVEAKTLVRKFQELNEPSNRNIWKKELIKWAGRKNEAKELTVHNISEAVTIANASTSAIVQVIDKLFQEQFIFREGGMLGYSIENYINNFTRLEHSVKVVTTLVNVLKLIHSMEYSIHFVQPTSVDYLATGIEAGLFELKVGEEQGKYLHGELIFQDKKFELLDYLQKHRKFSVHIGTRKIQDGKSKIDVELVLLIISNVNLFIRAIQITAKRTLENDVISKISKKFELLQGVVEKAGEYIGSKDVELQKVFIKDKERLEEETIKLQQFSGKVVDKFKKINLIIEEIIERVDLFSNNLFKEKMSKKIDKAQRKEQRQTLKEIAKAQKAVAQITKEVLATVSSNFNKQKRKMESIYEKAGTDILKYRPRNNGLLVPKEKLIQKIDQLIAESSTLNKSQVDQFPVAVSLGIFKIPYNDILDPTYNELITGDVSKFVREIQIKATDRANFESLFADRAEIIVSQTLKSLSSIFDFIEDVYIAKVKSVATELDKISILLAKLEINTFPERKQLVNIFSFPNIKVTRSQYTWDISYHYPNVKVQGNNQLDTLSDAMRFITLKQKNEDLEMIFRGLAKVADLIEPEAGNRLLKLNNIISKLIYSKSI